MAMQWRLTVNGSCSENNKKEHLPSVHKSSRWVTFFFSFLQQKHISCWWSCANCYVAPEQHIKHNLIELMVVSGFNFVILTHIQNHRDDESWIMRSISCQNRFFCWVSCAIQRSCLLNRFRIEYQLFYGAWHMTKRLGSYTYLVKKYVLVTVITWALPYYYHISLLTWLHLSM